MKALSAFSAKAEEVRNCGSHGEYTSRLFAIAGRELWTDCPECEADERRKADRVAREEFERERQERIIRNALKQAAIPPRFLGRTLESYRAELPEQKQALAIAKEYADSFDDAVKSGRCLMFCGKPGTGKTHLATGIAQQIINNGYTAAFTRVMDAIRKIRDTYGTKESESAAIKSFTVPDLLILDEVGMQRGTDDEKVLLFEIINARYEAMRPMILISNLALSGIKQFVGERAFDRLREGGGRAQEFTWGSHRGAA